MRRTTGGIGEDLETRLAELGRRAPEWRSWLALLRETLGASTDPAWDDALAPDPGTGERGGRTPLLAGKVLRVDPYRVRDLTLRIAGAAGGRSPLAQYHPSASEALDLLGAALRQDGTALDRLGHAAGLEAGALGAVAHLVAWPLLQACGRRLGEQIALDWRLGFCPICGAWPTVAELRGIERARRLRCGWCAADWSLPTRACPFCGEARRERLGALQPEGRNGGETIGICQACRGYLKTLTTSEPMTPLGVLLADLETVELDLLARERGWLRPPGPGRALELRVVPR